MPLHFTEAFGKMLTMGFKLDEAFVDIVGIVFFFSFWFKYPTNFLITRLSINQVR